VDVVDYEDPKTMDKVLAALEAEVVEWSCKTNCCGGSIGLVSRTDIVMELSGRLLDMALEAGGNCVVVDCPLCQANLDTRQKEIALARSKNYYLPIFYITELVGLAFGLKGAKKWLGKHLVNPLPLLKALGLMQP
jgi:heterodisulfide reductase subunit B